MNYFNIINILKNNKPNKNKTVIFLRVFGWICIAVGAWNFIWSLTIHFDFSSFANLENFQCYILTAFLIASFLFFYSAHCIQKNDQKGVLIAQFAIIILGMFSVFFFACMFKIMNQIITGNFSITQTILFILILTPFIVPAFFGVRYLSRLKLDELPNENITDSSHLRNYNINDKKYVEALIPFGFVETTIFFVSVPLIFLFFLEKFWNDRSTFHYWVLGTILVFTIVHIIYNARPSSFELNRTVIEWYVGGGSILLFGATWPFYKLIIYEDGIEIRFMFHRFFIPYDLLDSVENKFWFSKKSIYIQSNIVGVPSDIYFYGPISSSLSEEINKLKQSYIKSK